MKIISAATMHLPVIAALFMAALALSAAGSASGGEGSVPAHLTEQSSVQPKVGAAMDVAPFGEVRTWNPKADVGILWEDPRDIFKVVVRFSDSAEMPDPSNVKLEYWVTGNWPSRRLPREKSALARLSGWFETGDWFNGSWKEADAELARDGRIWTYTFRPCNEKEFPEVKNFAGVYRTTPKLRLVFSSGVPKLAGLEAYTDSTWQSMRVTVLWGGMGTGEQNWDGYAEAFNGYVTDIRPLPDGKVSLRGGRTWSSKVSGRVDGISMNVWYAKPEAAFSRDETVVTIRAAQHSFSFSPREVAEGNRVFIRDFGVLIKLEDDKTTYAEAEEAYQKGAKSRYDLVSELPEQTLSRAWNDMPQKGRIYMPVACEGGRQHFGIRPNGDVYLMRNWLMRIKSKDTERAKWSGATMNINFGLPEGGKTGASLLEGNLPIPTTWFEKEGIRYSEEAFATTLAGKLPPGGRVRAEEPQVLMIRFRLTNCTDKLANTELPIQIEDEKGPQELVEHSGLVYHKSGSEELLRMLIRSNGQASVRVDEKRIICSLRLPARATREFYVSIPFETLEIKQEIDQLKKLDYESQRKMIAGYWRKRYAQGSRIITPEPMLNDFYSANPSHQLINTENEVGTMDRAMAKVGTFHYGVFSNESIMMVSELDRRGYHDVAEKALETWIHYQGTAGLPGDYSTNDGVFYGARGYEDGGYNQHHGWVLWGMAEHYRFTRDDNWLDRVAPNLIKACDWITNERKRTFSEEYTGIRAIERGLLPQGSLEDIGDWRSWLSNNIFSWWGMNAVAHVLAERGHPEGRRLLMDAKAYGEDIRKAFFEAMVRSPVARLRDGTYVPIIPSDVHRRGRSVGWITEVLEGSIHLVRCGLMSPDEPAARWIMKDYEDNRYLAPQYGYQIPFEERDWFSLGGFCQQPSLLCSPTPYILLDEPKHYVRAYFNAFAAGYFPERAMLTEHPLPNLGNYAGDHFKSSDEAMNASWLRWMFIWDEGEDLYLGKTIPRYWLRDGEEIGIENAATHFGKMSMKMKSRASSGSIEMVIEPAKPTPDRSFPKPKTIYARFRHPEGKSMNRVTVNGKPYERFDAQKEWVILPPIEEKTVVVAYYD